MIILALCNVMIYCGHFLLFQKITALKHESKQKKVENEREIVPSYSYILQNIGCANGLV